MPQARPTLSQPFGQIIIAGGDEDIGPADLIDWVYPVLSGIPGGRWLTCEIASANRGCLTARIRSGARVPHLALCCTIPRRQAMPLCRLLPEAPPAAVILIDDHAAQVMTLLDGMARWLNVFELGDPLLGPLITLLSEHGGAPLPHAHQRAAAAP